MLIAALWFQYCLWNIKDRAKAKTYTGKPGRLQSQVVSILHRQRQEGAELLCALQPTPTECLAMIAALCAKANRKTIVGFPSHGRSKRKADVIAQGGRIMTDQVYVVNVYVIRSATGEHSQK